MTQQSHFWAYTPRKPDASILFWFVGHKACELLASLVVQVVKNLPTKQEIWVLSLGWEDPLEKGTAIHSSILAWEIPWTEEPSGLQSMGSKRVRHNRATNTFTFMWGLSSLTRDWTHIPCFRRQKSYPLDHQEVPKFFFLIKKKKSYGTILQIYLS